MSITPQRLLASAVAIAATALASGCGLGPGPSTKGTATLDVTRDYGAKPVAGGSVDDPAESETVLRLLDREAEITTRYGGGFVQSIDGVEGGVDSGRSSDWFFYVNGIESPIGSAEVSVRAGDRIWWDYRDWSDAMAVPAVVGSYPEPLLQAATSKAQRRPVSVSCSRSASRGGACREVFASFRADGIEAEKASPGLDGRGAFSVLVGPYSELSGRAEAKLLEQGPGGSGVFATFERGGKYLDGLGVDATVRLKLGPEAGIVAVVRRGSEQPTWIVSGTDERGVEAAAALLGTEQLHNHYAVLTDGSSETPVPITDSGVAK